MQNRSCFLIAIFFLALIGPWIELSSANNTQSNATELYDGDDEDGYLCYPDCTSGYGPQDRYDWYKVYLNTGEMLHSMLYNNGTPAWVYIDMTIFDSTSTSLTSTERVGHLSAGILTYTATYSGYYFIELEAISGGGGDDSYYRLSIDIETNNVASLADSVTIGDQFEEYVCARNCDNINLNPSLLDDPIDWYKVDIPGGTSWGLSVDKEDTYTYVDVDVYEVGLTGTLQLVQATEEGGPTYQYSTAWGNTTTAVTYYIRITASTTQGNYGTDYTFSLSSGEWYTVKEDSSSDPEAGFSYITINDVRPGEVIRAHAIRTYSPNDLDVLLYNESEFEVYKEYIRNNSAGTRELPSELLKKEDCWVCYIELDLDDDDVGLTTINPGRSANRSTSLSWTPTFYLVADYTDYLKDPPWNGVQDISHVFLSLDVSRNLPRTNQYYTVESWDTSSSSWQFEQSGSSSTGELAAPSSGWGASENESTFLSYTDYRITVRNASSTGSLVSQSQFRSINMAPIACYDTKGIENSIAVVHVPITLDSDCSSDPDSAYSNQDIVSKTWYVDGVAYNSDTVTGFFSETDTISIALEVEDDQGLVRWKNDTISIVSFPETVYTSVTDISGATTVRLDTNYTVNETLTWRPNWADAEVANMVIGVGLAFNFQRTHIGYVDVEIDPVSNGQFVSLDTEVSSSTDRYVLELKPEIQFYWYDVDDQTDGGNFSFPIPSMVERYPNQENFTLAGTSQTIYLWDQYDEVYNGTTLVDQYGQPQMVYENITLSAIDLYPLITQIASYTSVTGAVSGFINSFVDIEVLLEFGIMLELSMDNSLYMHSTTSGTFYDYDETSSLIEFTDIQTSAYDNYADSNTAGNVLDTTNLTGDTAFSLYPFYNWESDTEVYGFVNLTINIAPKAWITSILSWFMEDPDSLGQSWSYRLFESNSPIAASGNSGYVPITTRYDILAPNYDGDSYWDGADTDDDNDGILDASDSCSKGVLGWTSYSWTDYDSDGCKDSSEDTDDDNDMVSDTNDLCQLGSKGWSSSSTTDHDSDGCQDTTEDTDDDNDGVTDSSDTCSKGGLGWTSSSTTDHDADGCKDSTEDTDDDNDNIADSNDICPLGITGWTSGSTNDYDSDGCQDSTEDTDDDNDNILDSYDSCQSGLLSWTSSSTTDYDSDGCQDTTEDTDDDNDGVGDSADTCPKGALGWTSTSALDHDQDGCKDSTEDTDDDNDNIADSNDICPVGVTGWTSGSTNDYDSDGCQDSTEDTDDDNDNVMDPYDNCQSGSLSWTSSSTTDHDSDGCQDATEDTDDDNDNIADSNDICPLGITGWTSGSTNDYDSDGCQDSTEDTDDDNDNIADSNDICPVGVTGWTSGSTNDYDSDGCQDSTEDTDDDNDNVLDESDSCKTGSLNWASTSITDHDTDGCQDNTEDTDDDNDNIADSNDICPVGVTGWTSGSTNDYDSDGCQDSTEDTDDDNDNIQDSSDDCQTGVKGWTSSSITDYDSDGCNDASEDDDDDGDSVSDSLDACIKGNLAWISSQFTDYDSDGCQDTTEDQDDDNDGYSDLVDLCSKGELNWDANNDDYDSDGCHDEIEDSDDDNDGIADDLDACSIGHLSWISGASNDYDNDGCFDLTEDEDDDNDGINDDIDSCAKGDKAWTSALATDYDSDGCQDEGEDTDDDNDLVPDISDACSDGILAWLSNTQSDYDSDGCRDSDEDTDDDDDGVIDELDSCKTGSLGWFSDGSSTIDYDLDGCLDSVEDLDDDNDGVLDSEDSCKTGLILTDGVLESDYDGDGCYDETEDEDDDNDNVKDSSDACLGITAWDSTESNDYDRDGCRDSDEDLDDDNDGVLDVEDVCSTGDLYWLSTSTTDNDGDGCQDEGEDLDDDNDDVLDANDAFPLDRLYSVDSDLDGVADLIDMFPDNPEQSLDSDGDGYGDNSDGLNGDGCPDEAHAETPDGCAWTVVGWMKAHPAVSVGSPISALAIVGLVVLYLRRRPDEMASSTEKTPVPVPQQSPLSELPPSNERSPDQTDQNGYEWVNQTDGSKWYRLAGSQTDWQKYQ